ncbi:MAG: RNA 2',3'-cyclic phosphodiesterase [Caulobacterales bacterium]
MTLRLFAALPVPEEIGQDLTRFQRGVPGAAWRPIESFHITLRFAGEIDERLADDLDASLSEITVKGFDVQLQGAGHFGGADPHALWIGVKKSDALTDLAAKCERACRRAGLKPEPRAFTPHVTLAYLSSAATLDRVMRFEKNCALFESEPWRATWFGLYSSVVRRNAPSLYRVEAEYPLG